MEVIQLLFCYYCHRWFKTWKFNAKFFQGLKYIHQSDIGSHGSLKSSCCLIDSRWQLKVTSYGLHAFRSGVKGNLGDFERYKKLMWTAPELLRSNKKNQYGTKKGDIYSFGIITHEVVYRCMPFGLSEGDSPKGRPHIMPFNFIIGGRKLWFVVQGILLLLFRNFKWAS